MFRVSLRDVYARDLFYAAKKGVGIDFAQHEISVFAEQPVYTAVVQPEQSRRFRR